MANVTEFLTVDGSILEGGGQILRNAGALSCIKCQPIRVHNIRAGRSKPGLRPQHLTGLELIARVCNGKLTGGTISSTNITLTAKATKGGSYEADTKTAGSVCLLVQAVLPCLLFGDAPSHLTLHGGTNAEMAPQIDYMAMVLKPALERFGLNFSCDITKRGFFPRGGGTVELHITPCNHITAVDFTELGNITKVRGHAFVAGSLPIKIAYNMRDSAIATIRRVYPDLPIDIDCIKEPHDRAVGNGTGIIIVAESSNDYLIAGTGLGRKGVGADVVGRECGEMLVRNLSHAGCVDEYLQDQLIIFMALAEGKSRVKCGPITLHTETAIEIAKQLTKAKFNIVQVNEDENIIECEGIGHRNPSLANT